MQKLMLFLYKNDECWCVPVTVPSLSPSLSEHNYMQAKVAKVYRRTNKQRWSLVY